MTARNDGSARPADTPQSGGAPPDTRTPLQPFLQVDRLILSPVEAPVEERDDTTTNTSSGPLQVRDWERRLGGDEVRSVDRAASLLIAVGESRGEAGVTELAASLGLHKSTASRLLNTLQARGLLERGNSGKYRLGLSLIRLGNHAGCRDLASIATSSLRDLARSVHEATSLEVLEGDAAMTLAYCDTWGASRERRGRNSPLHASAPGKVLLASRPERDIFRLSRPGLASYTAHTITRVDLLLEELARVRGRGFATAFSEHAASVNAVAVPIFDHRSHVVAALEIRGPSNRILPSRVPALAREAFQAAAVITEQIGGVPSDM